MRPSTSATLPPPSLGPRLSARRCSRRVEPTHTGWRVVRVDVAEHLADALASFLEDEGVSALITEVHAPDAAAPPPGRTLLEAHVEGERERPLVAALTRWLESLRTIEPAAADVRIAAAPLAPADWEAAFRQ